MSNKKTLANVEKTTEKNPLIEETKIAVKSFINVIPKIDYDDLPLKDCNAINEINRLHVDNKEGEEKAKKTLIPLISSIDLDTNKRVSIDVSTLERIQYALFDLLHLVITSEKREDTENKAFNVYFVQFADEMIVNDYRKAKKSELRRPSSASTSVASTSDASTSDASTSDASTSDNSNKPSDEEVINDKDFELKVALKIVEHFNAKLNLKLANDTIVSLQSDVVKILESNF